MANKLGGKRENAGRKPKDPRLKAKRVSISLPPDVVEFLGLQKNASGFIVELVREKMGKEKHE